MKTFIITLSYLLLSATILAQKTEVYFGVPNRMDYVSDIMEIYDNGYYITGGFVDSTGLNKGWNIKTNVNLELLYAKKYEHPNGDIAFHCSASDTSGNIYSAGQTDYPDIWPVITKTNTCSEKQWCKILDYSYDGFDYGAGLDILINESNEIIVLVLMVDIPSAMEQIHLIALNEEGDLLWRKPYASKYDHPLIDNAAGYHVSEIGGEYYISGYCYYPYPNDPDHLFLRPLFIGIDSAFNEKWILPFARLDSVYGDAYNTIAINNSMLMGVGIRRAYNSNNEDNALLMFYNKNGKELGYTNIENDQLGSDVHSSVIRVIERINDTMFITGSSFGPDYAENPAGEFIIDTSGNIYNSEIRENTVSISLTKTFDTNYVFATNYKTTPTKWDIYVYKIDENLQDVPFDSLAHNYDTLCPGGIQSGTIDLTDCFLWTNVNETPSPEAYYASLKKIPVKAYPNPVTGGRISFEYQNTQHHTDILLKCFDVLGHEMHSESIYRGQSGNSVNVNNWPSGVYLAIIFSSGKPAGKCTFVVR